MAERKSFSDILHGDALRRLQAVWENTTPAADGFGPLPSGTYRCRIAKGDMMESPAGNPGYQLTFVVADGEHARRRFWLRVWLTEKAAPFAMAHLAKIGVTSPEQLERPLPEGFIADVKVVVRKNNDGDEYNEVRSFKVVAFEPPEPDPFAPSTAPVPGTSGTVPGTSGDNTGDTVHEEI